MTSFIHSPSLMLKFLGSSVISGDFTLDEAQDLANILKAGKLPASQDYTIRNCWSIIRARSN